MGGNLRGSTRISRIASKVTIAKGISPETPWSVKTRMHSALTATVTMNRTGRDEAARPGASGWVGLVVATGWSIGCVLSIHTGWSVVVTITNRRTTVNTTLPDMAPCESARRLTTKLT